MQGNPQATRCINSIIGVGVKIKAGATVRDSVIFEDVVIESGAQIDHAIIDSGTTVGSNCKIGKEGAGAGAICVIAADLDVPANTVIPEGAMISRASDISKEVK